MRPLRLFSHLALATTIGASCGSPFEEGPAAGGAGGTTTTTTTSTTSGAGGDCAAPVDECGQCLATSCTELACRCWGDPECTGLFACFATTCPAGATALCSKYCSSLHASAVSLAALYSDCGATHCATECPVLAGGALSDCQRCAYGECPSEMNDCLATAACFDWLGCLAVCGINTTCAATCAAAYPGAAPASDAVIECTQSACQGICL